MKRPPVRRGSGPRHPWLSAAALALALLAPAPLLAAGEAGHGTPWLDLLYKAVNFAILVGLLVYFLRKPVAGFLVRTARDAYEGLAGARRTAAETAAEVEAQKGRLAAMEQELQRMVADARTDAGEELQRLTTAANEQAAHIRAQTAVQVEQEVRKARLALQAQVAEETVRLAEETIRQRLDGTRQAELVDRYIDNLERLS